MQQMLLKEISKIGEKRVPGEQHEASPNDNTSSSSTDRPPGFPARPSLDPVKESMDEFKLSVKKVELPGSLELTRLDGYQELKRTSKCTTTKTQ